MKINPLALLKRKYTFEFTQVENVETEDIKDPAHLITWVEEENARILAEGISASVLIIKHDKKSRPLYAQHLSFPMSLDTDFDAILDKFYTRKPLQFDHSLLEDNQLAIEESSIPPMPVIKKVTTPPAQAQSVTSEGYAPVPSISAVEEVENNDSVNLQELIQAQEAQQKEIERLKKQLEEERKVSASTEELQTEKTTVDINQKKEKAIESIAQTTQSYNTIHESVAVTGMSFKERIDYFVNEEKKKIEIEILAADNRDSIEKVVSEQLEKEKEAAINREELDLFEKQAAVIEKEEQRHAAEMERINQEFEKKIETKIRLINEQYKQKTAVEIRSEYDRQTKELKEIFDKRMIELKKSQRELQNKLTDSIKSSFYGLDLELEETQEAERKNPPVLAELKKQVG